MYRGILAVLRSPEAQVRPKSFIVKDVYSYFYVSRSAGIGGCLSVGSNAAKTLAAALDLPIVGVHHMVTSTQLIDLQAQT